MSSGGDALSQRPKRAFLSVQSAWKAETCKKLPSLGSLPWTLGVLARSLPLLKTGLRATKPNSNRPWFVVKEMLSRFSRFWNLGYGFLFQIQTPSRSNRQNLSSSFRWEVAPNPENCICRFRTLVKPTTALTQFPSSWPTFPSFCTEWPLISLSVLCNFSKLCPIQTSFACKITKVNFSQQMCWVCFDLVHSLREEIVEHKLVWMLPQRTKIVASSCNSWILSAILINMQKIFGNKALPQSNC